MKLEGKTAFVTGGSGFIGGRLIEVLIRQYGMRVKALVRATTSAGGGAFRAAAAGAEIVFGSLLDEAALDGAVKGCDLVFHCAYGTHGSGAEQRQVTLEGTRLLARAAGKAGVAQFVHLSTVATFGGNTPAVVDERFVNPKLWAWPYAHDKLDAERALAGEGKAAGMPFTILRLGSVYGPYGSSFTVGPLSAMRQGRFAMVDNGDGIASATYVDDVVQAMLLAAQTSGEGETFMIRGPDTVTWRDLYGAYDAMVGADSLVSMTSRRDGPRAQGRVAQRHPAGHAPGARRAQGQPGLPPSGGGTAVRAQRLCAVRQEAAQALRSIVCRARGGHAVDPAHPRHHDRLFRQHLGVQHRQGAGEARLRTRL